MSMADYYDELKLTKSASHEDVTAGFRRLGLQWHPDRNPDNPVEARKKFDHICEAYDVLSNPLYRAIFDQHGAKGLKDGVADGRGGIVKGTGNYKFGANGDSLAIFTRVFGTDNPFAELFQVSKEFFDPSYVPPRTTAVVTEIKCSLEELMVGGIKVASVNLPGVGAKEVAIEIKRGWRDGAKLTMTAKDILKGQACPKALQGAEFTFVVVEEAHALYQRDGDDLVHNAKIPLVRALSGCTLELATLDGARNYCGCERCYPCRLREGARGGGHAVVRRAGQMWGLGHQVHSRVPRYSQRSAAASAQGSALLTNQPVERPERSAQADVQGFPL